MDKYPLIGKCLAVGTILLFVGTCIVPRNIEDSDIIIEGGFSCAIQDKNFTNDIVLANVNSTATVIEEPRFILPETGCPMAHCDLQASGNCHLSVPTENVGIIWHFNELAGERSGSFGLGFSGNGCIAACTFQGMKDNLVIYDYNGSRLWSSGNLLHFFSFVSAPMVDIHGRVIACDNRALILVDPFDYDSDGKVVEWVSKIPDGGLVFSPVITDNGVIILATKAGPIYAYDSRDGSLIAKKYLKPDKTIGLFPEKLAAADHGFFETINTPCGKGNRVYISTQYNINGGMISFSRRYGRLYAIDVDAQNPNKNERLQVAWYYEFGGPSGASPLLINNTIYFDGGREKPTSKKDPHIFAVTDSGNYGKEEWKIRFPVPIYGAFVSDPRGGFWVIDNENCRLVLYATEDGNYLDQINISAIVSEDGKKYQPTSVITICGNETLPIIVIAATAITSFRFTSYVIAIDLTHNNSLLWKVKVAEGGLPSLDFAFGQFPVVMKDGKPRVVFATIRNGAWAIGGT